MLRLRLPRLGDLYARGGRAGGRAPGPGAAQPHRQITPCRAQKRCAGPLGAVVVCSPQSVCLRCQSLVAPPNRGNQAFHDKWQRNTRT